MKVFVITNYLGNKGGLGRYSNEVVKELMKQGMDVTVVSESKSPAIPSEHGVLKPTFKQGKLSQIVNLISNSWKTRQLAKGIDIIHAHDGWPYAIYGYFAVLGTRKKLFITGIGTYTVAPLSEGGLKQFLTAKACRRASGIFCISDYVRDRIRALLPGAFVETVFMGTTLLPTLSDMEMHEYTKKFNLESKSPVILTVGDIKNRKGQLDTLHGLALLKKEYPNFLYVIFGSGDDVAYCDAIRSFAKENGITDNVRIVSGMYDDKALSFYYQACDLFALNSNNDKAHFEGFGLVFLEAAQFGKPAIGSRGCGIESAIKDGYSGYLTDQADAEDIAAKARLILKGNKEVFATQARQFRDGFSWQKTARQYIDFYTK